MLMTEVVGLGLVNCAPSLKPAAHPSSTVVPASKPASPPQGGVCADCVKWLIARVDPARLSAYEYAFSDGTVVYVDRHGVRRNAVTFESSPYQLSSRPEAALEMGSGRVAWLDERGEITWTASPLGPAVATHPPPSFPSGETIARVFQTRSAFFVVGKRTSVWRSTNGGQFWQPLDLKLTRDLKFRDVSVTDEQRVLLQYFPMRAVQSSDDGSSWKRVPAPAEALEPYHPWPRPFESDPAVAYADDDPMADEPYRIAGDQLVRIQVSEVKRVRVTSGEISGPWEATSVELPLGETIWDEFIAGEGVRQALAIVTKREEQFQIVMYRRENPSVPFVRLPPFAFQGLPPLGPLVSNDTYVLLDRTLPGARLLEVWSQSNSPQTIELRNEGAWPSFAFDSRRSMIWGFDTHGQVSFQRITSTTRELRMRPIDAWQPRILNTHGGRPGSNFAINFTAVTFDPDGTMRCIVNLFGSPELYLLRVRPNGFVRAILRLPFELPLFEGRALSVPSDEFVGAVSLSHSRGYSGLGWETADGGEHWTLVDSYTDARSTACIPSGCLVDQARRVGWALPVGFTGGTASTELEAISIPDAKARELRNAR